MSDYLYRGVNPDFYQETNGLLRPKTNERFEYVFKYNGTIKFDGSAKFGKCEHNAVLRHELKQKGFPTSGISTTPHLDRAKYYAFSEKKYREGFVYKIDRKLLSQHGVKDYVVSEYIPNPSVPEDNEVILVAQDFGQLPISIIVEILKVSD
ncbi:MAG: hypothetical protein ABSB19_02925 [Methylomonas sp.]|jgi:hypothetical protein